MGLFGFGCDHDWERSAGTHSPSFLLWGGNHTEQHKCTKCGAVENCNKNGTANNCDSGEDAVCTKCHYNYK